MGIPSAPPRRPEHDDRRRSPDDQRDTGDKWAGDPATGSLTLAERLQTSRQLRPDDAPQQQRPRRRIPVRGLSDSGFCWVAAHGGAGATSLAMVLGGVDLGCRWPDPVVGEPAHVVLVARTHAAGMRAASRALNAMREGRHPPGMKLVTLVLVADAPGSLPLALTSRVRVLRSIAPVIRVPWIVDWRAGKPARSLPKQLFRLGELLGSRPAGVR
ncbi:hypothetical protein [Dactylosporangium sp. CA-092794]|uniref:hypothetical protein n=1 Tax=Dactylosporangium sp. CA-092794 TaxID=3239929 RepID=UPI003D93E3EB